MTINFPNIDTSYWQIKDKQWMAERKAQWPVIEAMLKHHKYAKGKTAVKQYFLKGKMPDFEMFADWESSTRHVDLFIFLWLHPSWDEAVLKPLRDAYMTSDEIIEEDLHGIERFLDCSSTIASIDYTGDTDKEMAHLIYTGGYNEFLFKLMMGDLNQTDYPLVQKYDVFSTPSVYYLPKDELFSILTMSKWLCIKEMHPINNDMLYQYDLPLEWWYQSCTKDEEHFKKDAQEQTYRELIETALWRIFNFDVGKEGLSPRTTFVLKIRKILDERPFIKEFETMWQRVKAGEITVLNPWIL